MPVITDLIVNIHPNLILMQLLLKRARTAMLCCTSASQPLLARMTENRYDFLAVVAVQPLLASVNLSVNEFSIHISP